MKKKKIGFGVARTCYPQKCVVVTEAGSYLRLTDSCITQLQAQGHSRTCTESHKAEDWFRGSEDVLPAGFGESQFKNNYFAEM